MLSATAWPASAVRIVQGAVTTFAHPAKQMLRAFCPGCGETMFGINRLDMRVVPNGLAARASGGDLPVGLGPTMHLFYRHRVVDIDDRLIKYLDGWDGPKFFAGS
ncbi:glutathione-dependent formaldehyde-activating enzyme [Duganella sp. HH105]|nr:glutathione-dependent formaldehyde-activating enzyme [Duganella sp. HH105]